MLIERLVDKVDFEVALCQDCEGTVGSSALMPTMGALRSQAMPSGPEFHGLVRAMHDELCTITHYADAIAHARDNLRALRHAQASIWQCIARKIALISSIRILPTEILVMIIKYVLLDDASDSLTRIRHPVTRVCHLWRELALSMSCVWADIAFVFYHERSGWCAALEECLSRAKTKPLSISLEGKGRDVYEHTYDLPEWAAPGTFATIFLASAPQWRKLRLVDFCPPPWLNCETLCLPALECLDIRNSMHYDPPLICFQSCAALSTVHLQVVDPEEFCLPWGQLTTLAIRFDNTRLAQACVQILEKCDRLIDLTLSSSTCNPADYPDIVLPSLLSLSLEGSASFLFNAFRAVSLEKVVLSGHRDFDSLQESATRDPTICSTLTSLSLLACRAHERDWVPLLERYTNLSHLSVSTSLGHQPTDPVPHSLRTLEACLRHRPAMLPDLTHLDFPDLYVDSPECVHLLEDFVEARVHRRARDATALKSLAFGLCVPDHRSRLLDTLRSLEWVTHWTVEHAPSDDDSDDSDSEDSFDGRHAGGIIGEIPSVGTSSSGSVGVDIDVDSDDDWAEVEGQLMDSLDGTPADALDSDSHSGATVVLEHSILTISLDNYDSASDEEYVPGPINDELVDEEWIDDGHLSCEETDSDDESGYLLRTRFT
ncbi:hypothetical protein FB107DRAFT_248554 [Schizophyllum commune]